MHGISHSNDRPWTANCRTLSVSISAMVFLRCVFGGLNWVQLIRARLHRLGDSWTLADLPQLLWLYTHARSTAGGNFPDHCDSDWQEEDHEAKNKRGLTSSKYPPALLASSCFQKAGSTVVLYASQHGWSCHACLRMAGLLARRKDPAMTLEGKCCSFKLMPRSRRSSLTEVIDQAGLLMTNFW